ncbi:hypothetical protein CROQUDRAFT_660072 [Cronartium quercuum f. sp. fusiforme G11]|uniref:Uncharacterized protein n=1 Tax=Cronartium quercuum f. sp. fusiforme G11 TaxID=708437 RepID=A0A9P6NCX4_9BASI|nr:hypothetical protein CROQUDRAFT_660072 [Cronartium quercuum f. sp. fusiforme G11]
MSGRGAYYKALYGGGRGRGGTAGGGRGNFSRPPQNVNISPPETMKRARVDDGTYTTAMRDSIALRKMLLERDNRPYPAYRDIEGTWTFPSFTLSVTRVQSDSFAPPTRLRISLSRAQHCWPSQLYSSPIRRIALADWLTRRLASSIKPQNGAGPSQISGGWHGPKGGDFTIDIPGEQVLERTACRFDDASGNITVRLSVNMPARGRSIIGQLAADLMCNQLASHIHRSVIWTRLLEPEATKWVQCVEDQDRLRQLVTDSGLVAFIGNGSVLPRASGASASPMPTSSSGLVPFQSPPSLECKFSLPNLGVVSGMGIPKGITIIVGGGFHGKSTLLEAISNGPSNHTPTSGLNLVVTNERTIPLASEDGRAVTACDISPFIKNLPNKKDTRCFTTSDASGSTSMAASCVEAVELFGGKEGALLIDEDGCAVNFLIRDEKMRQLVKPEFEPFIFKVQSMYRDLGVSTIMVVGGCGDYFHVADLCIKMEHYKASDITQRAKEVAGAYRFDFEEELSPQIQVKSRKVLSSSLLPREGTKVVAKTTHSIQHGDDVSCLLDLSGLVQLSTVSQTRSLACFLPFLAAKRASEWLQLDDVMAYYDAIWHDDDALERLAEAGRADAGALARTNALHVAMSINRLRAARIQQPQD